MGSRATEGGADSSKVRSVRLRRHARPSLERRVPILIALLLLTVLAAAAAAAYHEVRRSALAGAGARLMVVAADVGSYLSNSNQQRLELLRRVAASPALVGAIRAPSDTLALRAAARSITDALATRTDSGVVAELWSTSGERVLAVGSRQRADSAAVLALARGLHRPGRAVHGELRAVRGETFTWVGVPVLDGQAAVGALIARRQFTGVNRLVQQTRQIIGAGVRLYVANSDDERWMSFDGTLRDAPFGAAGISEPREYHTPDGARHLVAMHQVAGTPWVTVAESDVSAALGSTAAFLRRMTVVFLALVLGGAFAAWLLGQHVARPLAALSGAADAIARGEYSRRVVIAGDDEVGRLGAAFNAMAQRVEEAHGAMEREARGSRMLADELEAANRAKSEFLAVMSHELRTPLNAIAGHAELLEMGVHGPLTQTQRDAVRRIQRSERHLLALINDVLDFARLEAGRVGLHPQPVSVRDALAALEPLVSAQLQAKHLTFRCDGVDPSLLVLADPDRLKQILANLLSNAMKFTDAGGSVAVTCDATEAHVMIHVADTGRGIPRERLTEIFAPFVQLDTGLTRTHDGLGLGLAISSDLAQRMQGVLSVDSEPGQGARFTLTLPRATRPSAVVTGVGALGVEPARQPVLTPH